MTSSDHTDLTAAAAELWALLHNGCRPEGRWSGETQRYYELVVVRLVASPEIKRLAGGPPHDQ